MTLGVAGLATLALSGPAVTSSIKSQAAPPPASAVSPQRLPGPLYGVTVDGIDNLGQVLDALRAMPQRPTTRIVFDRQQSPGYYASAVGAMHPVSYVMGELLDSSDASRVSTTALRRRVDAYLAALGGRIDVWEIGNEVNGNWLGPYPEVEAKLVTAYDAVSAARRRTALTLYYNVGCGDGASELDPLSFSRRFVPARVRDGLNFVLLSYYEQNCRGLRPSASAWTSYFAALHRLYPNARLGFGEVGLTEPARWSTLGYAEGMIRYYYGLAIRLPYYVGGYFWWYCDEDCVPYRSAPLFAAVRRALRSEAATLRPER